MPKLTIVIGANGAGKSTWCDRNRKKRLPSDFYNADSIAKGLGDWNSPRKQQAARELVDRTIEEHLRTKTDFGFESTYSGNSRPDIVRRAKSLGFQIEAIFVGTVSSDINVERVAGRVRAKTGHDVPVNEIQRRWTAAQENLTRTANALDKIELIDNSEKATRRAVRIRDGRETGRTSRVPKWADGLAAQLTRRVRIGGPADGPSQDAGTSRERKVKPSTANPPQTVDRALRGRVL